MLPARHKLLLIQLKPSDYPSILAVVPSVSSVKWSAWFKPLRPSYLRDNFFQRLVYLSGGFSPPHSLLTTWLCGPTTRYGNKAAAGDSGLISGLSQHRRATRNMSLGFWLKPNLEVAYQAFRLMRAVAPRRELLSHDRHSMTCSLHDS